MAGIAIIIILAGVAGWTLHYYKSRLDRLEQAQREQRLPYKVADEVENTIAALMREERELEIEENFYLEAAKRTHDRRATIGRLLEKQRWIRGNGQKGK